MGMASGHEIPLRIASRHPQTDLVLPKADGVAAVSTAARVPHHLRSGTVAAEPIGEMASGYPRLPDHLVGRAHRFIDTAGFFGQAEPDHGEIH